MPNSAKEIGIRKVLGSSAGQIMMLVFSDYSKLLLAAIIIACPVALLAMDRWLSTFAYRIDIPLLMFIVASAATVFIAMITVS